MDKDYLTLKRASASRPSGEWSDDDYDVLADGEVVGRIFKANAVPVGSAWMWTLAFWHHEDRTPTHGYEPTREAAMAAFAKADLWSRTTETRRNMLCPVLARALQQRRGNMAIILRGARELIDE